MGTNDMCKLVCMKTLGHPPVDAVRVLTTVAGPQGSIIKQIVGVGKPYWIWSTIPSGVVIAADFTDAPIASDNVAENNAAAAPLLADPPSVDPASVLVYAD